VPNAYRRQTKVCTPPATRHGVRALDRSLAALCVLPLPAPSCPAVARTAFSLRRRLLWAACRMLAGVPCRIYRVLFRYSFFVCVCIRMDLIGEGPGLLAKKGRCYTLPRSPRRGIPLFAVSRALEGDGLRGRCRGAFLFICPRLRGLFPSVGAREGRVHSSSDTDHARRLDEGQGNRHPRALL
jgi:hypothetical protein